MKLYESDWSAKNKDELKKNKVLVVRENCPRICVKTFLDVVTQKYENPPNKALKL